MKRFATLRNVPCMRKINNPGFNVDELYEFYKIEGLINYHFNYHRYFLPPNCEYTTTNPVYTKEGNFEFELWDEDRHIGDYIIEKNDLNFIIDYELLTNV